MKKLVKEINPMSGKLIVVDDNELFRKSLAEALQDLGYAVVEAENGLDGLQAVRLNLDADLVFVDLVMPVMDGYTFIKSVRSDYPDLPIVVISGLGTIDEALSAIRLGAWDFLSKPIHSIDVLQLTITRNVERYIALKASREYELFLENLSKIRSVQLEEVISRECGFTAPDGEVLSLYKSAFLGFPYSVVIVDCETGRAVCANKKFVDQFDLPSDKMVDVDLSSILTFENHENIHDILASADMSFGVDLIGMDSEKRSKFNVQVIPISSMHKHALCMIICSNTTFVD